jgi:hypothetical protein
MRLNDWKGEEDMEMYFLSWKLGDDAALSPGGEELKNSRSWYSSEACRRSGVLMP